MSFLLRRPAVLPTSTSFLPRSSQYLQPLSLSHRLHMPSGPESPPDSQTISEAAKTEGGPSKGSQSARLQSTATKSANLQDTIADLGEKLSSDGGAENLTQADASRLQSRVDRANAAAEATEGAAPSEDDAELVRQAQKAAAAANAKD